MDRRTNADPGLVALEGRISEADGAERADLRNQHERIRREVHAQKMGEVADEFDRIHSVERALEVGSIQRIIAPSELRPYLIDAVERGMARTLERDG